MKNKILDIGQAILRAVILIFMYIEGMFIYKTYSTESSYRFTDAKNFIDGAIDQVTIYEYDSLVALAGNILLILIGIGIVISILSYFLENPILNNPIITIVLSVITTVMFLLLCGYAMSATSDTFYRSGELCVKSLNAGALYYVSLVLMGISIVIDAIKIKKMRG